MNAERIERVTATMRAQKLPQILISATASVYYLTGLWVDPHERMLALLLDDSGAATLFGNALFGLPPVFDIPIVLHTDAEDPLAALAAALRPGTVGIDKAWPSQFLLGLMAHRADIRPVLGSAPVDTARKCKDAAERDAMRHSSRMNDEVAALAIGALRDGVREQELASLVNREHLARGADGEGMQLVCFGANGADPHHAAGASVLQPGDSVVFDIATPISRYWCDMTRTVFYKTVSDKQREVYELVRRANAAAIEGVRPGVALAQLDAIARGIITEGGYGPFFTHRLGHGCGLECHEPPDVSSAGDGLLQPGMVFSIEPGIYLPGAFGVRIEDLVLVTETGCEVLNRNPKDLQVI
ncbi:MAG: M24 family metallopeptidase [Oscillospiraceae bacterium]